MTFLFHVFEGKKVTKKIISLVLPAALGKEVASCLENSTTTTCLTMEINMRITLTFCGTDTQRRNQGLLYFNSMRLKGQTGVSNQSDPQRIPSNPSILNTFVNQIIQITPSYHRAVIQRPTITVHNIYYIPTASVNNLLHFNFDQVPSSLQQANTNIATELSISYLSLPHCNRDIAIG